MKSLSLPFLLAGLIICQVSLSGCISPEPPRSPWIEPETGIRSIPTTISSSPPYPPPQTTSTAIKPTSYSYLVNPPEDRIVCGENLCPQDWFCCNGVCYNPKDAASGYCCGNTPCPNTWGCCSTKNGDVCYDPTRYECVDEKGNPPPVKSTGCLKQDDCSGGLICCMNHCANIWNDPENCGSCGSVCSKGYSCKNARCVPDPCPAAGEKRCLGVCTDIWFDPDNCGDCGITCPSGSRCQMGTCILP